MSLPRTAKPTPPAGEAVPRRRARWLKALSLVTLPLVLAVLLFQWHERRQTTGGRSATEWSQKLLSGTPAERQQAEAALRTLGSNAVPSLCRALLRPDSRFRTLGERVARRGPTAFRGWIYRTLLAPDPNTIRMAAAQGLAVLGPGAATAIPDLVSGMFSQNPSIAWQASQALARIGPAAVPALIPLLDETDPAVRLQATAALGQIGRAASPALPALIAALETTNQALCNATLQALTRIWTNPVAPYSNLLFALHGPAREAAARAVRQFNFPSRAMQPGLVAMLNEAAPSARQTAVQALGTLPGWTRSTFEGLLRARADSDAGVRTNALAVFANPSSHLRAPAPGTLAEMLAEPAAEFRVEAALALGRWGPAAAAAVPALAAAAAGADAALREAARVALRQITNAAAR